MPFGFVTKGEDFRGGRREFVRVESVNFFFFLQERMQDYWLKKEK